MTWMFVLGIKSAHYTDGTIESIKQIIVGDFNSLLLVIDITTRRQNSNKSKDNLISVITSLGLTGILLFKLQNTHSFHVKVEQSRETI